MKKVKKCDWWLVSIIAAVIAAAVICIATSGCNTMYGFGRDIKTISAPYTTDDLQNAVGGSSHGTNDTASNYSTIISELDMVGSKELVKNGAVKDAIT